MVEMFVARLQIWKRREMGRRDVIDTSGLNVMDFLHLTTPSIGMFAVPLYIY